MNLCRSRGQSRRACAAASAWLAVPLVVLVSAASSSWANKNAAGGIYTCTNDKGRRLTSDRPIAECRHREQVLLNRDGSVRSVIPPTETAEERAEREARERRAAEQRAAQTDAVRRDRTLLSRFPNEEAHARAREQALDPLRLAINATERRMKDLAAERVPLLNEAEFYIGKPLPQKVRLQLDANDAAMAAQKSAAATQAAERGRVNKLYDDELERLRRLWAGAPPGSLGPVQAEPEALPASGGRPSPPRSASAARR